MTADLVSAVRSTTFVYMKFLSVWALVLLADFVLEPAMKTQSGLANMFGGLFGNGPGAGMGLLIFFSGLGAALVGLAGYFVPVIRNAESILPDHD